MSRPQRKAVKREDSTVPSEPTHKNSEENSQVCRKLNRRRKSLHKRNDEQSLQSKFGLKEISIVLEDICRPSAVKGRAVFSDKTNRSLILSSKRVLRKSSPQQNKTSAGPSNSKICPSESTHTRKSVVETAVKACEMEPTSENSTGDLLESHINLTDKCVYAGVKRETLMKKNMPLEEKLAEYEFEIDENEPVVKAKKKRKVKRKGKVQSPDWKYYPRKGNDVIMETAKGEPNKVLGEKNLKSKTNVSRVYNCQELSMENKNNPTVGFSTSLSPSVKSKDHILEENISCAENKENTSVSSPKCLSGSVTKRHLMRVENSSPFERSKHWDTPRKGVLTCSGQENKKIQSSASSHRYRSVRRLSNSFVENLSPTARGKNCESFVENLSPTARGKNCESSQILDERGCGNKFSEIEVSAGINNSQLDLSVSRNTFHQLQKPVSVEDPCGAKNTRALEYGSDDENKNSTTTFSVQKRTNIHRTSAVKTPISTSDMPQTINLNESVVTSSPANKKNESEGVIRTFLDSSVSHFTYHPKVHLPRVSSVHRQFCKELEEKWTIENCFGFEDDCKEIGKLTSESEFSCKQRPPQILPVSSTPLVTSKKKKDELVCLSTFFKRQHELTSKSEMLPKADLSSKVQSPKLSQAETKSVDSPLMETVSPSVSLNHSPFANPLKQAKLDFASNKPETSSCKTPQHSDMESPLLFKDEMDKTPVHFNEPARRSYVRTIRRKMKPVGDEWIEIDSGSEEEHEHVHKSVKKTKKDKPKKQNVQEVNKWIKNFNEQCEEIEDFELCVE